MAKRAVTAADMEKFPVLAEKEVAKGAEQEFNDETGEPVFEEAAATSDGEGAGTGDGE